MFEYSGSVQVRCENPTWLSVAARAYECKNTCETFAQRKPTVFRLTFYNSIRSHIFFAPALVCTKSGFPFPRWTICMHNCAALHCVLPHLSNKTQRENLSRGPETWTRWIGQRRYLQVAHADTYILGKEREKESAWRGSRIKIATIYYCQKWNDTRSILMRNNDINFIFYMTRGSLWNSKSALLSLHFWYADD